MMDKHRFGVFNIHRRFGKTVLALNEGIKTLLQCPLPRPQAAYIAPLYRQAKTVAWDYLRYYTSVIPGMKYNQAELKATFPNGAKFFLFGGDNPDSLRGIYLDKAILDEVAQMSPRLWSQVIRPALADRKGKAMFIGTPFGTMNSFYDLYQMAGQSDEWCRATYKASETNVIDSNELDALRAELSPEEYEQELECSWSAAIKGAFYAKQMTELMEKDRLTDVPYDNAYPVHTAWDLGVKDATVITYFQLVGMNVHIIRCEAFTGMKLGQIIQHMNKHSYIFGTHIAPHDIAVRELGGGSRKAQAAQLGVNFKTAPSAREVSVHSGINMVRNLLERCYIDKTNANTLIEALKAYRSEYNDKRQVYSTNPLHDWTSDYADSMRYLAITVPKVQNQQNDLFEPDYSLIDQGTY